MEDEYEEVVEEPMIIRLKAKNGKDKQVISFKRTKTIMVKKEVDDNASNN